MPIARNARRSFQFGLTAEVTSGASFKITSESAVGVNKAVGSATAVTLPNLPFLGKIVCVKDAKGDALTNNITVSPGTVAGTASMPATATIDGAATMVLNSAYQSVVFIYTGSEWKVFSNSSNTASNNATYNNLTLTGLLYESAVDSIAAAGSTQTGATPLTAEFNRVTTATAAQGVRLPASAPGLDVYVENHSGAQIVVYGAGTDKIDDVATGTGVNQMDSSVVLYTCYTAGNWYSNGLATGYAKNPTSGTVLETQQFQDAISAAGSTQAGGTQLVAGINTVSTVTASQGVNLPASAPGLQVTVINTGANPLTVYPAIGASDTINGYAATIGIQIFPGTCATFNCTAVGAWTVSPATTKAAAFNTNSNASGAITLTAAQVTGGTASVDLALTGAQSGGVNATLPTVAAMTLLMHAPTVGTSFRLRLINEGTTQTITLTTNTGWTLTGTLTIANNTWREYVVTLTSLTTATAQNVATGTFS